MLRMTALPLQSLHKLVADCLALDPLDLTAHALYRAAHLHLVRASVGCSPGATCRAQSS